MPYTAEGYRARALRKAMTGPEIALWLRLKTLRAEGFQIRRQAPFRGYYLDFVCFSRRVVIEVDGDSHLGAERVAHDRMRDEVLRREGFTALRIGNDEVRNDIDAAFRRVRRALDAAPVSPPGSRQGREPPSP